MAIPKAIDAFLEAPLGYTTSTRASLKNRLLAFARWCKGEGIQYPYELTSQVIDRWVSSKTKAKSRRTINRDLRALRVCLEWAAERGHCDPVPAVADRKDLREPKTAARRVIPSPAEWQAVLAKMTPGRPRAALAALLVTGLRIEELRRLHVGMLHQTPDGWVLSVTPEAGPADTAWTTKGYRSRDIPLNEDAAAAVKAYLAVAVGKRGKPIGESKLLKEIAAACKACDPEVPRAGVHDTRRSFATEAYRAGVQLLVIAKWMGHADVRTTETYLCSYRTDRAAVSPVRTGAPAAGTGVPNSTVPNHTPRSVPFASHSAVARVIRLPRETS